MPDAISLQARFQKILEASRDYGDGGREVLETAYHTLALGREMGRWPDVGLEDLWAHAIKEGRSLFNKPEARWAKTGPVETKDMIGQTTIGPWQMTVTNVRQTFGRPFGVRPEWTDGQIFDYTRARPAMQAGMICDYIQNAYVSWGTRSPYAIQSYFWLEAFVKNEIGQGRWDKSVLPVPPDGDWTKLTPAMKADTGFYAKQILLGHPHNPHGLLYWLWITSDTDGISSALETWATQTRVEWNVTDAKSMKSDQPGNFRIVADDLKYIPDPACRDAVQALLPVTTR
ncbi:MAG: hypothetical protein QM770_12135 [Tepidisphaeraceae bacterium]